MVATGTLVGVRIGREVTFGDTSSVATWKNFKYRAHDLGGDDETAQSTLILPGSRGRESEEQTGRQAGGTLQSELIGDEATNGAHADLIESILTPNATWSTPVSVGPVITISFAAAGNQILDSGSGFGGISAGDWVRVRGSASNDGVYRVGTAAAGQLDLDQGAVVDETAGASITVDTGAAITDGIGTRQGYSVEAEYKGLPVTTYLIERGAVPDGFQLEIPQKGPVTLNFVLQALAFAYGTVQASSSPAAVPTTKTMFSVNGTKGLLEGGAAFSIVQAALNHANNTQRFDGQAGTVDALDVQPASIQLSGNVRAYFNTADQAAKASSFAKTNLTFVFFEKNEKTGWVFHMPSVILSNPRTNVTGQDDAVFFEANFTASQGAGGFTVQVAKWQ